MNTNSNSYTIIYASVMVIIVAFVLAFTSASLKERQNENERIDKMKQILSSLNVDTKGEDAAELYNTYIQQDMVVNAAGAVVAQSGGFDLDVVQEAAKPLDERKLPLYVAEIDGVTKYIVPLRGSGLWGPIWGYIALDEDYDTIYGTYFSHQGETPGLGAEIATDKFQLPFKGKRIKRDGQLVSVAVVKPGKTLNNQDYVDGISGGTITSVAVEQMLKDCLAQYANFLNRIGE